MPCCCKCVVCNNVCVIMYIILVVYCYSGLDKKQREVAMIAEMIHSASLIHDDVIDQSDFRRGKPSVNALWSHKKVCNAILCTQKSINFMTFK